MQALRALRPGLPRGTISRPRSAALPLSTASHASCTLLPRRIRARSTRETTGEQIPPFRRFDDFFLSEEFSGVHAARSLLVVDELQKLPLRSLQTPLE